MPRQERERQLLVEAITLLTHCIYMLVISKGEHNYTDIARLEEITTELKELTDAETRA